MPVEAYATGTPVVASAVGGAAESVSDGVSGLLLENFSRSEMRSAADALGSITPENCRQQTEKFDRPVFHSDINSWVGS
jgi:glycosyltransferase involved in cell wall biosynthesis